MTAPGASIENPRLKVLLAASVIYAVLIFLVDVFLLAVPPPSPGSFAVLAFLVLFLGLAHGAFTAFATTLIGRLLSAHRWPRGFDVLVACSLGLFYSALVLSLLKFSMTGAHLRFEDLWFVFGNLRQIAAEGSARERGLLAAILLLPIGLAIALFMALRISDRRNRVDAAAGAGMRSLAALVGVALAALLVICWRYPYARYIAGTVAPETSWVARHLTGDAPLGTAPGAGTTAFLPDPGHSRRIGSYASPADVRRDNVVILMLESVPWSRIFGPLARPEATPRINALAAESIVFARAYATATHSDYAQTSILAALHPRKFPRHDYFIDLAYPRTLIWDLLRPLGYRTALFSCQNEGWGNMQAFLRTPGLELFRHAPDWPDAPRRGEGSESKVFEATPARAFKTWLRETDGAPFLAYLNFQATHYPYVIPPDSPPIYEPSTIDFPTTFLSYPRDKLSVMENRFYNALHTVDTAVGEIVDALRAAGVWEQTALLVVSDHGEAFYEHGVPTHGTMLLEEQIRTAAFLRLPGEPARVVHEPISVLDLVPAVANFLGLPPHGNFQGRSDILEPAYNAKGRPLLFTIQGITQEDALLLDDWKLLENRDRRERALFDLATDPGERRNLAAKEPAKLAELERQLSTLLGDQLAYYGDRGWEQGWYPPKLP
ncbi:MAG: sulfatase-like hydrolase/transferase [Thermoanaerobaculia bacterium]